MRRWLASSMLSLVVALVVACDDEKKGFDNVDAGAPVPLDASSPPPRPADAEPDGAAEAGDDAGDAATNDASDASGDGPGDGAVVVVPPTVNGAIGTNEYGVHTEGQNQKTEPNSLVTWFMTWNDVTFHVAITGANVNEGAIVYFGAGAVAPNVGTDADGTTAGFATYDNTRLDPLPFRATAVLYFKNGYQELRAWNGVSAWGAPNTTAITYVSNGNVREIAVPWTAIRAGGRPSSFAWTGYVTTAGGFAYGEMPIENVGGQIGTSAAFPNYYKIMDASPGTGTKPFAIRFP